MRRHLFANGRWKVSGREARWPYEPRQRQLSRIAPPIPGDIFAESLAVFRGLEAAGIDYAVDGAFAVAFHGVPRATTGIDILIRPGMAEPALLSVKELGYDVPALSLRFSDGMKIPCP